MPGDSDVETFPAVVSMSKPSLLIDLSLLRTHPAFRAVFIARLISILSLGLLAMAVAVQVQAMTGSPAQVGLCVTLTGIGMFVGLVFGGVLADRFERRRLILLARSTCGLGFLGLALNAALPTPSLLAIYVLGCWDGFFGAIGVTALLAATPALVGRENMVRAGAISQLTVRLGTVASPLLGGLLIAQGGVLWNYLATAFGTLLTVLLLLRLPALPAPQAQREHPLRALATGFRFLFTNKVVGAVALVGALVTMASAVRVLYPALASDWHLQGGQLGLLFAATPFGAALGTLTSGRVGAHAKPGQLMLFTAMGAFACILLFGLAPGFSLAWLCLAAFGYLSAINALLQYAIIQAQTPDALLGRVNGLWTAQNICGDAVGAALLGGLGAWVSPAAAATGFGIAAVLAGLMIALGLTGLRRLGPATAP
ncbi:enterobactin transporter EntS [Pseudomonas massiliensis]|uniref:enterobactin transporter EntS n=1 Tax=Pseudomonas massiliensis TaxID=522492 RepID=UPI000AC2F709|nr:enterobactin transporter EntS [Pseudomonas massiliensis]